MHGGKEYGYAYGVYRARDKQTNEISDLKKTRQFSHHVLRLLIVILIIS
jgi:hypothetical protein